MNITIDLRCLQKGIVSGVETYTYNVVNELLHLDSINKYNFFYNAIGKITVPEMHFVNSQTLQKRVPNRLLALTTQFGWPKMEKYAGEPDIFWMPNLNHATFGQKTKLVLTVHDTSPFRHPEFYDLKRNLWHKTIGFRRLLARADKILAVSECTKLDLTSFFGVPAGKIIVTHEGVDHQVYHTDLAEADLRLTRNLYELPGKYILYLGTLEPRKNVAGLIEAFDLMKTDAWLVLAGRPGWKYKQIFEAIKNSPKKNRIKLLGFVEEAHKPHILKLASSFAFPSFYEGFGLPVLESMAVGTPVVTSSLTSLPEITDTAALLVNPYNTEEVAFALEQTLDNKPLRDSLVSIGLERSKLFTWQKTAQKTLDALQGCK